MRGGFQAIDGCGGGDIERAEVRITPRKIRWLLWQENCAQVPPAGIPNPNPSGSSNEQISGQIHFHPVRHTFALTTWLFAKDAAVLELSAGPKIVNTNVSLLAVVHVKPGSVRRKCESVGLREF